MRQALLEHQFAVSVDGMSSEFAKVVSSLWYDLVSKKISLTLFQFDDDAGDMKRIVSLCSDLHTINVTLFDTSNNETMDLVFVGCVATKHRFKLDYSGNCLTPFGISTGAVIAKHEITFKYTDFDSYSLPRSGEI